jgi:hypothetical protein
LNGVIIQTKLAKKTAERENTDLKNRIEGEVARYERLILEDIEALTQKNKKITVLENTLTIEKCNREIYKDCFTVSGNKNKFLCDEMQTLRGEKSELEAALEDVSVERDRLEGEVKALKEKTVDYRKTWINGPVKIKLNCSGNTISSTDGRGCKLEVNAEAMAGTQVWNSSGPRVLEFFCSSIQTTQSTK